MPPHGHSASQLLKTPHHDANLFRDQLPCQDDSAKDILESFNELTIVNNGDGEVTEVKMYLCTRVCVSLCACVYVCLDIQRSVGGI